jgi:hypothetical protein
MSFLWNRGNAFFDEVMKPATSQLSMNISLQDIQEMSREMLQSGIGKLGIIRDGLQIIWQHICPFIRGLYRLVSGWQVIRLPWLQTSATQNE